MLVAVELNRLGAALGSLLKGKAQIISEVIALAVYVLQQSGLRDFQIELGQAQFVTGFLKEAGLTDEQCAAVSAMTEQKSLMDMEAYLTRCGLAEDAIARLMQLPRLYGDASVLDEAEKLTQHPQCLAAIDNLRQIMAVLKEYGCDGCISIDLGMAHQANYYSGTIFRGLVAELGQPLMSGGRYDRLTLAEDLSLQAGSVQEDTLHEALWRSDGTADQLYLALRLAVAEELTPQAPLVLDDAFVRFDDDRLKEVLQVLNQSGERKQVILFTCQSRERKIMEELS